MSQQDLLRRVIDALDGLEIPYMVSGSLVSSLQGEPRATHDVDVVIDISPEDLPSLTSALDDPNLFFDPEAAASALQRSGLFNLIDSDTGDKVDFWPLTDAAFDRSRFSRRQTIEALGMSLAVSTAEDTILKKLDWSKECGGSEKHYTDALRVYEVQAGRLDEDYIRRWADELGVRELLDRIVEEAETL